MKTFIKYILLSILLVPASFAAQLAIVKSEKAVVYADMSLSTPIGYVRQGKKLLVGEVKRMKGLVLPVVVSGRVAYIQVDDILLKEFREEDHQKRIREHDIEESFKRDEDKLNENNFLVATAGVFTLGEQWDELSQLSNNTTSATTSMSLLVEHRPINNETSWGIGISYFQNTQETLQAQFLTVDINLYRDFFKTKLLSVQAMGGFSFSGDNRITIAYSDGDQVTSRGSLLGGAFGVQARIRPHGQWGVTVGGQYRYLKVMDQDEILIPDTTDYIQLSNYSGAQIYVGVNYAL